MAAVVITDDSHRTAVTAGQIGDVARPRPSGQAKPVQENNGAPRGGVAIIGVSQPYAVASGNEALTHAALGSGVGARNGRQCLRGAHVAPARP